MTFRDEKGDLDQIALAQGADGVDATRTTPAEISYRACSCDSS
jgi:hypothetical protein